MSHPLELLSALVDGELGEAEGAAVHGHLEQCPGCARELAAVEHVRSMLRALPAVEPPGDLVEPARRRLRARARATVVTVSLAAAAAAVLLAVAPPDPPVAPPVGDLVEVHATSGVHRDPVSQLAPAAVPTRFPEP